MTASIFTLCDSGANPVRYEGCVYCWSGYGEKKNVHSLLRYVETHGESLRQRYLAWIHDFGETMVDGKRLIDHLAFEDGLSYWWMTLLAEKSPWKSPAIADAIRLLALEEIVSALQPAKFRLVSTNQVLHVTLRDYCRRINLSYEWVMPERQRRRSPDLFKVYRLLPQFAQALIGLLRYAYVRWPFRKSRVSGWFGGNNAVLICSYFFNLDISKARQGHFQSRYWEGLHGLMNRLELSVNWLQLYYPHAEVPSPEIGINCVKQFNRHCEEGFHEFLDAHLSWGILLNVLKRWIWLGLRSPSVNKVKSAFQPAGAQISLWPLLRSDWKSSMSGSKAIDNLLWIELFDSAFRSMPHQHKGLYLCENQAWERAMIHAWHRYGHGQLIAVPHSTVRFWDLRYCFDQRILKATPSHPIPEPDLIALNGRAAFASYINAGYPKERLIECEALRYGYLHALTSSNYIRKKNESGTIEALILGDYLPAVTKKMMCLIESSAHIIDVPVSWTFRPHPNCLIDPTDYPSLSLKVTFAPLVDILPGFDVACASNMTSAAVDAYLANLPVIVVLDENDLNFSPLRGQKNVIFVDSSEELASALPKAANNAARGSGSNAFFFLNMEFPRWQKLLGFGCE